MAQGFSTDGPLLLQLKILHILKGKPDILFTATIGESIFSDKT